MLRDGAVISGYLGGGPDRVAAQLLNAGGGLSRPAIMEQVDASLSLPWSPLAAGLLARP